MKARSRFCRRVEPHSLGFQLLSRSILIMAGLFILIGVFQYFMMQQFSYDKKEWGIQSQIRSVSPEIWIQWKEDSSRGKDDVAAIKSLQNNVATIAFIEENGNVSDLYVNPGYPLPVPRLSKQEYREIFETGKMTDGYKIIRDEKNNLQMVICLLVGPADAEWGIVQATVDLKEMLALQRNSLTIYVIGSLIALIVGMLIFRPVLQRTMVPLSRMVNTVERIHSGNLDERLPNKQGPVEIDRLAVAFNGMLKRIETSFAMEKEIQAQMRRFVADASHELRTPLTSIQGFLEVLLEGGADKPDQLQIALESMYSESERLNKLVGDLLALARMERSPDVRMNPGNLGELIRQMEPQLQMIAGARRIRFDLIDDPAIAVDTDKIKQVILNLFQNAVQQTDPMKGNIRISLEKSAGEIRLSVQDNGFGIKEIHLPHIFERFFRGEPSRARKYGGAGLGLSITKSIVELHGGRIEVESREGKGALFRVCLPLK
ncbi:sensor histidine kinase [Paenibacillus prosopidis]|uniref:histidine kinase n=1 Tax=Paenibacillus prosopidis TaxID=630520 RepID=A0A368VIU3_9BACL|nr:HAMP domain-containing sensor histidine kinase [Paenibacillus prosopidis]RCW41131.1 two-component system OmpR family sensor kinase [Paenibacillus prosopidis]